MNPTLQKSVDNGQTRKLVKGFERWKIVRRGIEDGKSVRASARELGCDDHTVLRDLKILDLPPEQIAAIKQGDSAEKYLNEALLRETGIDRSARNKLARRRRDDEASGKHSGPLANDLLAWLSNKKLTNSDTELVLTEATHYSKSLADRQPTAETGRFEEVVAPLERKKEAGRLDKVGEPAFIEQCARKLVRALDRVEPVQVIRQAALRKAITSLRARGHWTDRPKMQQEKGNIAKRRNLRGGK